MHALITRMKRALPKCSCKTVSLAFIHDPMQYNVIKHSPLLKLSTKDFKSWNKSHLEIKLERHEAEMECYLRVSFINKEAQARLMSFKNCFTKVHKNNRPTPKQGRASWAIFLGPWKKMSLPQPKRV